MVSLTWFSAFVFVLKMSYSELEVLYSPSKWSKRYSADQVISQHIKFAKNGNDAKYVIYNLLIYFISVSYNNKQQIPCKLDVPYGIGDKQKYDIFGIDLSNGKYEFFRVRQKFHYYFQSRPFLFTSMADTGRSWIEIIPVTWSLLFIKIT